MDKFAIGKELAKRVDHFMHMHAELERRMTDLEERTKTAMRKYEKEKSEQQNHKGFDAQYFSIDEPNLYTKSLLQQEEPDFTDAQLERIDEIHNAVHDLLVVLTEKETLDWDMAMIGPAADALCDILTQAGHEVRYPARVEDSEDGLRIVDYVSERRKEESETNRTEMYKFYVPNQYTQRLIKVVERCGDEIRMRARELVGVESEKTMELTIMINIPNLNMCVPDSPYIEVSRRTAVCTL